MINIVIERFFLSLFIREGRESGVDAAIVSVGWSLAVVIIHFVEGISTYGSIAISNAIGEEELQKVGSLFWNMIYSGIIGSIIFIGLVPALLYLLPLVSDGEEVDDEMLSDEQSYCRIVLFSLLIYILFDALATFFATIERENTTTIVNVITIILNIAFDYVLILPLHLGYIGAAIAGPLTKFSGFVIFSVIILFSPSIRIPNHLFSLSSFKPHPKRIITNIWKGLLIGAVDCIDELAWTVVFILAQNAGEMCVTDLGYVGSINDVFAVIPYGTGHTPAGQKKGGSLHERTRETS